jgi:RecA/RadA recombinase
MKGKVRPVKAKKSIQETSSTSQKQDSDAPSAAERTQSFIKMMNSAPRYRGKVQVRSASDYRTPYYLRRPTGVLSLDIALGGGFPAGGASQVFGARSSGKTHMCFSVAGQIQKNYGDDAIILIAISEHRADKGFARMSGLCVEYTDQQIAEFESIRKEKGQPPFTAEEKADLKLQIGQVTFLQGTTGGSLLDTTLEAIDHFGSACQLIIVDSLGSLLTPDQEEKSVSDKHYGGSSGIITLWQTKMQPKFINDLPDGGILETTILGINQVRAQIGGPIPGATRPAAGSKAWEHAQLTSVEFKQGEPLWADAKHSKQSGRIVKWAIKKGKAGTHDGAKGEFNWFYFPHHDPVFWKDVLAHGPSFGADKITDLVDTAKQLGVLEIGGAWRTFKDVEGKTVFRAQGDEAVVEKVVNDPELATMLKDHCNLKTGLTVRYK